MIRYEDRVFACLQVRQRGHGRGGVQLADGRQWRRSRRPSNPGGAAEGAAIADLYRFSSPGAWQAYRQHAPVPEKVDLPAGTKYAILTTEAAPHPDAAGHVPSEQEMAEWQHVRPVMNEILQGKGLIEVAEGKVSVTEIKGPLEEGWQHKVAAFAARIPIQG